MSNRDGRCSLYPFVILGDGDINNPFGGSRREICFRSSFLPVARRSRSRPALVTVTYPDDVVRDEKYVIDRNARHAWQGFSARGSHLVGARFRSHLKRVYPVNQNLCQVSSNAVGSGAQCS